MWSVCFFTNVNSYSFTYFYQSIFHVDIANTGFLVVKNTPWSIRFFHKWWDHRHLPHTHCDQHVLNFLLHDLKKSNELHHIAILPAKTINSHWPSIVHFNASHDRILHLMGETAGVRRDIFQYASTVLCNQSLYSRFRLIISTSYYYSIFNIFNHACFIMLYTVSCNNYYYKSPYHWQASESIWFISIFTIDWVFNGY